MCSENNGEFTLLGIDTPSKSEVYRFKRLLAQLELCGVCPLLELAGVLSTNFHNQPQQTATITSTSTLPFNATGSLETEGNFISRGKRSNSLHSSRPRSVIAPSRSALAESSRFSSSGESLASSEEPSSNRGTSQTETFIVELIGTEL